MTGQASAAVGSATRGSRPLFVAGLLAAALLGGPLARANSPVEPYLSGLRQELDPRAAQALDTIDGPGRQLLAARAYVRTGPGLAQRWSWTAEEAAQFEGSPARAALDAAVARVRCEFEAANPGHTLFVNPSLRTLEIQVQHWNMNESVTQAAAALLAAAEDAVAAPGFRAAGTPEGRRAFARWLAAHETTPTPTIAAPGLSLHGQMHAIDFQVQAQGRIVAGADTRAIEAVWNAGGWTERLRAAVEAAAAGFVGPLARPNEPWHYDYRPRVGGAMVVAACVR
jgi:hypothetical protein